MDFLTPMAQYEKVKYVFVRQLCGVCSHREFDLGWLQG
jgi:hypothetical protein